MGLGESPPPLAMGTGGREEIERGKEGKDEGQREGGREEEEKKQRMRKEGRV